MARFCSICGAAVAPATAAPPAMASGAAPARRPVALPLVATTAPVQAQGGGMNKAAIIALVSGIVLIGAAAFLFVKSAGVLNAQKPTTPVAGVINAPNTQPLQAPILTPPKPNLPNAPVLQPPPTVGNPMPEDVIEYLRWLKKFETERKRLEAKNTGEVMPLLMNAIKDLTAGQSLGLLDDTFANGEKPTAPAPNYAGQWNKVVGEWNIVCGLFKQRRPPDACAPLASSYGQALDSGVQELTKILGIMGNALSSVTSSNGDANGATGALTALNAERSGKSSSKSIDALYNDANFALDALRSRYTDIPPDISAGNFNIKSDGGSFNLPGLGL